MARIVFFPAGRGGGELAQVTRCPVRPVEDSHGFDARLGGQSNRFRLNIDPWDLQRIVAEANRLGRGGVEVMGFAYDYDNHAVLLGPRKA